jgi:G-protein signaling modulator 2
LAIAQELGDKIGEARACWSLGNAHAAIGNHEKALHYAQLHLFLAKELQDPIGETTARINIGDLKKVLNVPDSQSDTESLAELHQKLTKKAQDVSTVSTASGRMHRLRRQSMEQLDLIKLTPDGKKQQSVDLDHLPSRNNENYPSKPAKEEDFFEMLSRTQSKRMDDQRCTLKTIGGSDKDRKPLMQQNNIVGSKDHKKFIEMIADFQSERMNEQRCEMLPGWKGSDKNPAPPALSEGSDNKPEPDERFFDTVMRFQGSRYEEQRSELPKNSIVQDVETNESSSIPPRNQPNQRNTLPDEDFFSLIMRVQGGRMEDQRFDLKAMNSTKNPPKN